MSVRLRGTIVAMVPVSRDLLHRWQVTVHVDEVLDGQLGREEVALLVHSPSRTFHVPDPVGASWVITLDEPIGNPHTGPVTVEPG